MPETIYDYPHYYDILFGWDRSAEAQFYTSVFVRHGNAVGAVVAEIACGTGQVTRQLARRGWRVTGIDNSAAMLEYMTEQARAEGLTITSVCADMETLPVGVAFAAAFNPMSSFRLLPTDAAADAHLRAMSATLRPAGVYVLDMAFVDSTSGPNVTTNESWTMDRDGVTVEGTDAGIHVDDHGVKRTLAWGAEMHLRPYTYAAFAERVRATATFAIVSLHNEVMGADGIGRFDIERATAPPAVGRTMIVLERISG